MAGVRSRIVLFFFFFFFFFRFLRFFLGSRFFFFFFPPCLGSLVTAIYLSLASSYDYSKDFNTFTSLS